MDACPLLKKWPGQSDVVGGPAEAVPLPIEITFLTTGVARARITIRPKNASGRVLSKDIASTVAKEDASLAISLIVLMV